MRLGPLPCVSLLLSFALVGCASGGDKPSSSSSSSTEPRCGDGHVDTGEQCDDGAKNGTTGDPCSATCTTVSTAGVCGDGHVDPGEQCDDGAKNGTTGDPCSATCTTVSTTGVCGDGHVDPGEQCDDGSRNGTPGDACSSTCTTVSTTGVCGDGNVDPGEQCDDGAKNGTPGDPCSSTCTTVTMTASTCGDGHVDPGERCDDGANNGTTGDPCTIDCQIAPKVTVCQTLAPLSTGTCAVTTGDAGRVVVGTVLTPGAVFSGGQVVVDTNGNIVQVGCKADCDSDPTCAAIEATATAITCPTGVVSPGLINTHDHITYTQDQPYTNTGERYEHRHQWREGQCGHTKIPSQGGATADQISWGELRFLFGGATSTVGSGGELGLLRNLDKANLEQGLNQTAVDFDTFPLDDSSPPSTCNGPVACTTYKAPITPSEIAADNAYFPHVSEGINSFTENEFACLSEKDPAHDVIVGKTAVIHGVGLTAADYGDMATNGTSLIWSPRSNITLYGDTARVAEASRLGVRIALGTDWMPSGSMNLLRELQCADSFNTKYLDGYFSDKDLWTMVTANAAAVSAMGNVIGTLAPGLVADISIFDGSKHPYYRAVIDATPDGVVLVLRAGKPLYGDASVVAAVDTTKTCDTLDVCSTMKSVCLQSEISKTLSALQTSVGASIYPAFFCGAPTNEPSCLPARTASVSSSTIYTGIASSTDADGDGIPDATDNCPNVFNPARPMDNGVQPDADGDGLGDACDPCPLDATNTCPTVTQDDSDGDGVPNATDDCPTVYNPTQADGDMDGHGDACDLCPTIPNPGASPCAATIYQIKTGVVLTGAPVTLSNQLVTGRATGGFYLQVSPSDPAFTTVDDSGIFVASPANTVAVGDRVTITTATVATTGGRITLASPTTTIVAALGEASPAPVVVASSDVATGGPRATALESVIVQVADATVTDTNPPANPSDTPPINEFVVDSTLRVNDYLYLITPFPVLGQGFASLSGILDFENGDSKLELRSAADVVLGAPGFASFTPATSFTDVGLMAAETFPTALTVTLTNAPSTDTFVTITPSDPTSLGVVGGGVTVPAGQTSAPVLLNGLARSASVTLTATYGAVSRTATVRVVDPTSEQPSLVTLTPTSAIIPPGATQTFTVGLDIPAPAGGVAVGLALIPTNAGAVPVAVTIPQNQTQATFDYVDGSVSMTASVAASLGTTTLTSSLTMMIGGACTTTHLLISEVRSRGAGGAADEFVELYNPTTTGVTLDATWVVDARSYSGTTYSSRWKGTGTVIPPKGHFLIVGTAYTEMPASDGALSSGITDASSVRLTQSGAVIDSVCFGYSAATLAPFTTDATYSCNGTPVTNPHNDATSTNTDASIERAPGGVNGNCTDTGDDAADFAALTPANPQDTSSPSTP